MDSRPETSVNRGSTMPRDIAYLHGGVKRKYQENGEALIDIECWIENQRGEITTPGGAVAALPRRAK